MRGYAGAIVEHVTDALLLGVRLLNRSKDGCLAWKLRASALEYESNPHEGAERLAELHATVKLLREERDGLLHRWNDTSNRLAVLSERAKEHARNEAQRLHLDRKAEAVKIVRRNGIRFPNWEHNGGEPEEVSLLTDDDGDET